MSDISFSLTAFSTVLTGMLTLTLFLYLLRAIAAWHHKKTQAPAPIVHEPEEKVDDPELIAVIATAAYAALGKKVRVHAVHIHRDRALESWSRAGRMDIMFSHQVGPKR